MLIRQATGPKPCAVRTRPSQADAKAKAAEDILRRYKPLPPNGDSLADLFGGDG